MYRKRWGNPGVYSGGEKQMTPETLRKAIDEAKRFIEAAEKVKIVSFTDINERYFETIDPGKAPAACKRASMDLTRVLSDLRQGR
jgi:hypothetical protein